MICGTRQKYLILIVRNPDKANYYRRRLRAHVEKCEFCNKQLKKKKVEK